MKFSRRKKQLPGRIELTALIDIMFILNIFFMLNAQSFTPRSIDVNLPAAETSQGINAEFFEITVNDLNQILLKGQRIPLEDLQSTLEKTDRETMIVLKADRESAYGKAIEIFDLLRSLKFEKVHLETLTKY